VYFPGIWGLTTSSYIPLADIKNPQRIRVLHIEYTYILIQYTYISIQYIYFLCSQNVRDSHGGGHGDGGGSDPVTYTECPRRNVPDFGRVFLMLKYTDISQNTYVQS